MNACRIRRRGLPAGLLLMLTLLCALAMPAAALAAFRVQQVTPYLEQGVWFLDASINYRLSPEALEALVNGVPLTVLTQIQVRRVGAWIWEDSLVDLQTRQAIRYRPLSDRHEVYTLPDTGRRGFVTREAALRALGEVRRLELLPAARLAPDTDYEIHIRVALDPEELPLPLRPLAYLKRAWKLSSGWTTWPLRP